MSRARGNGLSLTTARVAVPASIKSGVWEAQKWKIESGALADWFYLKVDDTAANRPLRDWLWKLAPPMADYAQGKAWQWCLPSGPCFEIWKRIGVRLP